MQNIDSKQTKPVSWDETAELGKKLASVIREAGYSPDYLIGITAGGLVPLALIAQELNIRKILTVSASSYEGRKQGKLSINYVPNVDLRGSRVLLIDEVAQTGETLRQIRDAVKGQCNIGEIKTAVFAVDKECKFRPDFFALEDDSWVAFPWEKD